MANRIDVKVTTGCGNSWVTGFNGTYDEAKAYFMGVRFEIMKNGREHVQKPVVSVEQLS